MSLVLVILFHCLLEFLVYFLLFMFVVGLLSLQVVEFIENFGVLNFQIPVLSTDFRVILSWTGFVLLTAHFFLKKFVTKL